MSTTMKSADFQENNSTNRVAAILNLITSLPLQIIELVHTKTNANMHNTHHTHLYKFQINDERPRWIYTCFSHHSYFGLLCWFTGNGLWEWFHILDQILNRVTYTLHTCMHNAQCTLIHWLAFLQVLILGVWMKKQLLIFRTPTVERVDTFWK